MASLRLHPGATLYVQHTTKTEADLYAGIVKRVALLLLVGLLLGTVLFYVGLELSGIAR